MFFTLESITHTHSTWLCQCLTCMAHIIWHYCHSRVLSAPHEDLPRLFPPLYSQRSPLSHHNGAFSGPRRENSHKWDHLTQPQSRARTPPLLWHLGLGWMFHISELWALNSTGQMFHGSFWISSPVKPRQPKRGNLFFLLFFLFSFLISKMSFNYVSLFLTGFLIMKVIDCSSYKLWVKASHLF